MIAHERSRATPVAFGKWKEIEEEKPDEKAI